MRLKAGSMLVIETGEYSDYSFTGPFRVIKDLDQAEVIERYQKEWTPGPDSCRDQEDGAPPEDFVPWLTVNGFIEDVPDVHSWHVGSYGRFEAVVQAETATDKGGSGVTTCKICLGVGWVCECHGDRPWAGVSKHPSACDSGAGDPCPECNFSLGKGDPPRMPPGTDDVKIH